MYMVTVAASAAVRAEPACFSPTLSKRSSVRRSPAPPSSRVWFEAVEQPSYPASFSPSATSGGDLKAG